MTSFDLLLTLVLAAGGAFFGAYFKEKGKNLATHEDIGNLVEQVAAVTKATKEIEAKISSELWDRQKRWELKRDVLFELAKRVAAIFETLGNLNTAYAAARKQGENVFTLEHRSESNRKWFDACAALDESKLFVDAICDKGLQDAVETFKLYAINIAYEINKDDPDIYRKSHPELRRLGHAIVDATRKGLGVTPSAS